MAIGLSLHKETADWREHKMECPILEKEEITEEECLCIRKESYKDKNGRTLQKKIKRIIGWKAICKACKHHTTKDF